MFKHLGSRVERKLVQRRREETARRQIAPEQSLAQTSPREIALYKVPANRWGFLQAADRRR